MCVNCILSFFKCTKKYETEQVTDLEQKLTSIPDDKDSRLFLPPTYSSCS